MPFLNLQIAFDASIILFLGLISGIAVAEGLFLTSDNATSNNPPNWQAPASISKKGIFVRPIRSISVLSSSSLVPRSVRSKKLNQINLQDNKSTVINGTFFYWLNGSTQRGLVPMGKVIRNNVTEFNHARNCSIDSGAVAVVDGRIIVARSTSDKLSILQARFGNYIDGYVGCGVLLIEGRRPLTASDIVDTQGFAGGVAQGVCRPTNHMMIGIRNGTAYALFNPGGKNKLSCKDYQILFRASGFGSLIKFDGSSGFYFKDSAQSWGPGAHNPTGFLIREW